MTLLTGTLGDTLTFDVTLTDGDDDPLDLAGLDLTFTASHPLLVITKTIDDGITVTDESGGLATIVIDPADVEALEDRMILTWTLEVTDGVTVSTPLEGELVLEAAS